MTTATARARRADPPAEDLPTSPAGATSRWPLERLLFALAGTMTLVSAVLAAVVSPWFLLLTAFIGVNQWVYVALHHCPASLLLGRVAAPQCTW